MIPPNLDVNYPNPFVPNHASALCVGGIHFNAPFIKEVIRELQGKALLCRAGLDSFTRAEKLAYELLVHHDLINRPSTNPNG